jgi:hypothetical protein
MKKNPGLKSERQKLALKTLDTLSRIQALKGQLIEEIVATMSMLEYTNDQAAKTYEAKSRALDKACGKLLSSINQNERDMVSHLERRGFLVKFPSHSLEHAVEEISRL